MADNVHLIMRFHPVGGEDLTVSTADFTGPRQALDAAARALDERRSLILTRAKYDSETDESAVVVNLANVVFVRVSSHDDETTSRYL
jgi:hypothetical protein